MINFTSSDSEIFINPRYILAATFSVGFDPYHEEIGDCRSYSVELRFMGYPNSITYYFESAEQAEEVKAKLLKALKED